VEATAMLGKGGIHLTGQLRDVIKESSQIDVTWVYHIQTARFIDSNSLLPSSSS
jgi:ATP-dependent Lon protease